MKPVRQHSIPKDNPPITEAMTQGAGGASPHALVQRTIVTAYTIPGDGDDVLLLLDNGRTIGFGVDIGYRADYSRNPDVHEVFVYDATDTEAGRMMREIDPGEWL